MFPLCSLVRRARRLSDDAGQATVEYVLVALVAGAIALTALAWARGTSSIADLFETVIHQLVSGIA